ncbi:MAG TPA: aminotransferase class V-fold PLP-dependent enzyme, partial [Candidatus Fimenecus stercoravium]|nr:aminotransferase class V-fold PLP-dependent enzyme [Candidatus Fimenecus stercoravium]
MECYLDNSATTKPCQEAVAAAVDAMTEHFGNPSSLHQNGMAAQQLLERARKTIADSLRAENSEIVFTPSGTAANNTAIFGAVARYRSGKIVTSAMEHPSVEQ